MALWSSGGTFCITKGGGPVRSLCMVKLPLSVNIGLESMSSFRACCKFIVIIES